MVGCCIAVQNQKFWASQWARTAGALHSVWLENQIWILPNSMGFPPSFPDQKIEGQLLPVIRKLSESQQEAGSWPGAGGTLSTLQLQGHLERGFAMLLGLAV